MSSYVAVANLAATFVGTETRITSPDDDRFVARTIRGVWDLQRKATIRDGAWNFAMRREALAAEYLAGGVPYPWQNAFPLPAGCLRLIEVLNLGSRDDYQLEGRQILANTTGPLYIRFLVDVAEPEYWDELFAEAFARRIALTVGTRIAGSNFPVGAAEREYQAVLARAKTVDAGENPPIVMEESDWIRARFTGAVQRTGGWA